MTTKAHAQYFCNTFFIVSTLIHIRFHRVKEGIQIIDHSLFITCQDIVHRQGDGSLLHWSSIVATTPSDDP